MSSQIEILKEFKSQLLTFVDELITQFPQEGDLVILRVYIDNQAEIKQVMEGFIYKINCNDNQLREMIKQKNEVFFIEHDVFSHENLSKEKINHFKKLWLSGQLDEEDKNVIWSWIDAFVFLADKYIKLI
jgi:hypothetical protein